MFYLFIAVIANPWGNHLFFLDNMTAPAAAASTVMIAGAAGFPVSGFSDCTGVTSASAGMGIYPVNTVFNAIIAVNKADMTHLRRSCR